MSTSPPLPLQSDLGPDAPPPGLPPTPRERALRDAGGFLSAIVPGAGHFLQGRRNHGIAWLVLAAAASSLWWGFRLPHVLTGLALSLVVTVAVWVFSSLDALFGARQRLPRAHPAWALLIVPIAAICGMLAGNLFLRAGGFRVYPQNSDAMQNTILTGETVVTDTHAFNHAPPRPGDVIAFDRDSNILLRRVLASGPVQVQGKDGAVVVNGVELPEPYARHAGPKMTNQDNFAPVAVTAGEYFVAGDNRDVSLDSRQADFGPVTEQAVRGKALYIFQTRSPAREGRAVR